jgi:serine/threonine protein phosphatase PrpC
MTGLSISYQFCALTDPGRVRANEDAVTVDPVAQLAVLADGMGGYNAGEVASGMATTFIQAELSRWIAQAGTHLKAQDLRRAIEICVDNANQAILGASRPTRSTWAWAPRWWWACSRALVSCWGILAIRAATACVKGAGADHA